MRIAAALPKYRIRDKKVYRLLDGVETRCWFGWTHELKDDFGDDPRGIDVGDFVETLGGHCAKVLSIDEQGYARLEGVQSTRFTGHLRHLDAL